MNTAKVNVMNNLEKKQIEAFSLLSGVKERIKTADGAMMLQLYTRWPFCDVNFNLVIEILSFTTKAINKGTNYEPSRVSCGLWKIHT